MAESEESKTWIPSPDIARKLIRAAEIGVQLRDVEMREVLADDGSVTDEAKARQAVRRWLLERGYAAFERDLYDRDFDSDPPPGWMLKAYHFILTDPEIL